jgi:hypothetical protein
VGGRPMIRSRIKADDLIKKLNNTVKYSNGFISELNKSKALLNQKVGNTSIAAFYDYLDGLARSHPGMLHHVYEWGEVGNPMERLYDLSLQVNNTSAVIDAEFLESNLPSEDGGEPFYNKAIIMEEGIPVTINEKNAKALAFTIDGQEYFRVGPITIANPGGEATRGSFVEAFNEFYGSYFTEVYLPTIRFYDYFSNPKAYEKHFASGVNGGGAATGRAAALSWIAKAPGEVI